MGAFQVKTDCRCSRCARPLLAGTDAAWDRGTRTIHCVACDAVPRTQLVRPSSTTPAPAMSTRTVGLRGAPGASAQREHDKRAAAEARRANEVFGPELGPRVTAFVGERQSIQARAKGADGEQRVAAALGQVPGILVLHDRHVPRGKANIDHIVLAPSGVYVVDAKRVAGAIQIRNVGGEFRLDERLFVGGRDRSWMADGLGWQISAVLEALRRAGMAPLPPVHPVLCFVDGRFPSARRMNPFRGVLLESERSLQWLVAQPGPGDPALLEWMWRRLHAALPAP